MRRLTKCCVKQKIASARNSQPPLNAARDIHTRRAVAAASRPGVGDAFGSFDVVATAASGKPDDALESVRATFADVFDATQ